MQKAISGDFGESLICLELSHAGWPLVLSCRGVATDVLAVSKTGRRIIISVKCRDRRLENPSESTFVFRATKEHSAIEEIARFKSVCNMLGAEPWVAIVTIKSDFCYAHMTSLRHYERKYMTEARNKSWSTAAKKLNEYADDPDILGNKKPGEPGIWEPGKMSNTEQPKICAGQKSPVSSKAENCYGLKAPQRDAP